MPMLFCRKHALFFCTYTHIQLSTIYRSTQALVKTNQIVWSPCFCLHIISRREITGSCNWVSIFMFCTRHHNHWSNDRCLLIFLRWKTKQKGTIIALVIADSCTKRKKKQHRFLTDTWKRIMSAWILLVMKVFAFLIKDCCGFGVFLL